MSHAHNETPSDGRNAALAPAPCSAFFIVRLRGGTVLKLKPGRGQDAQFDRLFALLDECEVWQAPTDWDAAPHAPGKWISGTRSMAGACTSDSTLMPEYMPNNVLAESHENPRKH